MSARIFFVHTVSGLVESFGKLAAEIIPGAEVCHISDDSLIRGVLDAGGLTPAIRRRICDHVVWAAQNGADAVQLTCSSVSPCADLAGQLVSVPVLKIDEPMVEQAVAKYSKVGVIATAPTTLAPSTGLIRDKARDLGRPVEVESVLCEGAYQAFLAGDREKADEIVREHLRGLMKRVEVVLLAQASMARVAESLDAGEAIVPVLSSPRPAVQRLAEVLAGRAEKGGG